MLLALRLLTLVICCVLSPFSIVPVAVAVAVVIAAPVGLDRVTVKVSSGSTIVSPLTLTVMILAVSLAAKLTVPLGNAVPPKSSALAPLVPLPVTAHLTLLVPVVTPVRLINGEGEGFIACVPFCLYGVGGSDA